MVDGPVDTPAVRRPSAACKPPDTPVYVVVLVYAVNGQYCLCCVEAGFLFRQNVFAHQQSLRSASSKQTLYANAG